MTSGDRVKELRKSLNLTLEKFGEHIGLKKNSLSSIETGRNALTDQTILSICKTNWNGRFVNEEWLRTGNGEMFKELDREQEIALMVSTLFKEESESFKFRFIKALCNMNDAGWDALESFVDEVANKKDRDM